MRIANVREFREHVSQLIDDSEPVIVTKYGKPAAVLMPLREAIPGELKDDIRRLKKLLIRVIGDDISKKLDEKGITEEDIERDFRAAKASRKARRR